MVALALIIALALGGGVSFAAENAVPGDALYVVKTEVNENVRAALAVSAEADARWHVKAAERRLQEAERLSARGELTADVTAELAAEFSQHAEAALEGATTLAEEGHTEASSAITTELETTVAAYADLFARAQTDVGADARVNISSVLNNISATISNSGAKGQVRVQSGDTNGGGTANVHIDGGTVKSETSVRAEGGSSAEAGTKTKMEGSVKVDLEL